MKLFFRLMALLLASALFCGLFVSCDSQTSNEIASSEETVYNEGTTVAEEPADALETTNTAETVKVPENESEYIEITPTVEELLGISKNNYNADFFLTIMQDTNLTEYHWVEESENDVLSQAIYARQQNVYDYLGVEIFGTSVTNYQEYATPFKAAVKNKDGSVDMMLCHVYASVPSLVSENYLADISTLPGVNVDADYWNRDFMDDLTVDEHYYLGFSDFNILYTHVITFNKDLMEKYSDSLEKSVYDMVRAKEWTLDEMISLANLVYVDETSNGKSNDDTFGITGLHRNEFPGFLHASGIKIVEQGDDGQYRVALMNEQNKEKTAALAEKLCELCKSDCSYFDYRQFNNPTVPLTSGRTLMHLNRTYYLADYLDYEISFGVLPYPLWDSTQDSYHHLQWGGYITVPSFLRDEKMAGETLELLSYFSDDVKIAYYEKMLGKQVADVLDDSQMLEIVWNTVCTEFAQTYSQVIGGTELMYLLSTVTEEGSSANIASKVAGFERSANSSLSKFMKKMSAKNQ